MGRRPNHRNVSAVPMDNQGCLGGTSMGRLEALNPTTALAPSNREL